MMTVPSSIHIAEEIAAVNQLHPLAKRYIREIKERVDLRAAAAGANLYYCARDTLAALEPDTTSTVRGQAASSATVLLSLHAQAKGYKSFTNGLGVRVWARPL